MFESALRPLPATLRRLLKSPLFTLLSILTLGIGIGANSALFSVVNGVILEPLPYEDEDRLVGVWSTAPGLDIDQFEQSMGILMAYREHNRVFEDMAAYATNSVTLTEGDTPERLGAAQATASLFPVLRARMALGRPFNEDETRPGAEPVAVLSHRLWQQRWGGDPNIVGTALRIDGVSHRVIGVADAGFHYPEPETSLWVPLEVDPDNLRPTDFNYPAIARLRPGVDVVEAQRDLDTIVPRLPEIYPDDIRPAMLDSLQFGALVNPLRDDVVGDVDQALWLLFASVGFILLIACANVANLFLVRSEGRQQEMSIRHALGASRRRLAASFLGESLWVAGGGTVVGLGLAFLGLQILRSAGPQDLPRLAEVAINGRVLLFTLAVALLSSLFFGLLPALRRLPEPSLALKEGGRSSTSSRLRRRVRSGLVVAQVALALVLLVGSGLMIRSFEALRQIDPGFSTPQALILTVPLTDADYPEPEARADLFHRALEALGNSPGVDVAGAIENLPLASGYSASGHAFEDFPIGPDDVLRIISTRVASPGYFEAMGIPLVRGRVFEDADHLEKRRVALISKPLADRLWPDQDPVGRRLLRGRFGEGDQWTTIVGVVGGVRHRNLTEASEGAIYYPMLAAQVGTDEVFAPRQMTFVLKSSLSTEALVNQARGTIRGLDPNLPIARVRTLDAVVADARAHTAFTMVLLSIAAAVALLLGAVGLYGVITHLVGQRTQEIGVRMALGASRSQVARMVLGQGLILSVLGIAVGAAVSLGTSHLLRSILFEVSPHDPWTFIAVAVLLLAVSAMACFLPTLRAVTLEPLRALRYE